MSWAYTLGQIFVMFDLPTLEKHEIKAANDFRKTLLDFGFFMMQESVYVRNCVTIDKSDYWLKKVRNNSPTTGGNVVAFFITAKQWNKAEIISCVETHHKYRKKAGEAFPEQITFW
jgi:CRISPR-associated protein Cas2